MGISSSLIPSIIIETLSYLFPKYQEEEGLFRLSGTFEQIQDLKNKIDGGNLIANLLKEESNCHNVSGLLKLFIRELPNPLYPKPLQSRIITASQIEDKETRRNELYEIALQLPHTSYAVLKILTITFNKMLDQSGKTKMSAANLSTVWAPNLIWNREIETNPQQFIQFSRLINLAIQATIEEAEYMFKDDGPGPEVAKRRSLFDIQFTDGDSTKNLKFDKSILNENVKDEENKLDLKEELKEPLQNEPKLKKRPRSIWLANELPLNQEQIKTLNNSSINVNIYKQPQEKKPKIEENLKNEINSTKSSKKSLRSSFRKSLLPNRARSSKTVKKDSKNNLQLFYYADSDHTSVSLKKFLDSMDLIPLEIRNSENDSMNWEEIFFFARRCETIVTVVKTGKPYTVSHIVSDMTDDDLKLQLISDVSGKPKAPLIIIGSIMIIGFEKNLKDIFRYYFKKN